LQLNWDQGFLLCKERGMNLYSPNSQAEHNSVIGLLTTLRTLNATYFDNFVAIDGQFVGTPSSASSVWQTNWFSYATSTRLPITMNWGGGEPNFLDREFCLSLRSDLLLNNCECGPQAITSPMRFLCKRTSSTG
jgi:hypothetical protein